MGVIYVPVQASIAYCTACNDSRNNTKYDYNPNRNRNRNATGGLQIDRLCKAVGLLV